MLKICALLDEAEAKVEAELRWFSRRSYTLIEAFVVEVGHHQQNHEQETKIASGSTRGPNSP
jgi:hypothetical protein